MASRSSADKLKPLPPDPDRHHQHSAIPQPRSPTTQFFEVPIKLSARARQNRSLLPKGGRRGRQCTMETDRATGKKNPLSSSASSAWSNFLGRVQWFIRPVTRPWAAGGIQREAL